MSNRYHHLPVNVPGYENELKAYVGLNGELRLGPGVQEFHCQTKRGERDHEVVTLPSECRLHKASNLSPWGGKGDEAAQVRLFP